MTYETIVENKNCIGIVPVHEGGVCGGCNLTLSPNLINQLRRTDKIIRCTYCSRILYI